MGKGYKRELKLYRLRFEDPDMAGLEVVAKSLRLREFLDMNALAGDIQSEADAEKMYRRFGDALVEWNLLDENDEPVPATYEGLADQELDFVLDIIRAWQQAIAGVDPTSPAGLNSGGISPEASLPMAPP